MTREGSDEKLSKVELIKEASVGLRGSIAAELADSATDRVEDATTKLLKFHGTYQQDDRDLRLSRRKEGLDKAYSFMVRNRIPGGKMTAAQFLGELDIADELGNGTIRITTRQSIQLHGVVKGNLWDVIHRINEIGLSTQSACGDVTRNVCCCPAPLRQDSLRDELQELSDQIAQFVRPRTGAYHEIWIRDLDTGESQQIDAVSESEPEPLYGNLYLPRKFKIGLALCDDNCIDVYDQDLGLLAVTEGDRLLGFNVLVGGGMGTTPSKKNCFPALAHRMAFVTREELFPVIAAIIMVQRDFGNREDRSQARMKYLIHNWGLPRFKAKVEEYLSQGEAYCNVPEGTVPRPLADPHRADVTGHDDHMGWHEQADGKWFLGLPIENGRVKDEGNLRLKTALRQLFSEHVPTARLTAQQNILLCDLDETQRPIIEQILAEHGVDTVGQISNVRRFSFACPALPTCGLAVTESERALPSVLSELEAELAEMGLAEEKFTIRMTGCPNGCARPYNADIGLVGRSVDGKTKEGKYTIFVGGNLIGTRLNVVYKDMVLRSEIVSELRPMLICFQENRKPGESLGDFCHRWGVESLPLSTDDRASAS
ncbi:NADPH-dependent assimilatory sulfite reductase hemoprotein subunit [Rubinisphaera margarita]|uniref:NADPH-dependent assimilatory sulfite reductase hemoprotein subunit n=1 Tax=Rubinisphaera margarita TaxID=2909586 RepID=UPI001EE9786F|nr:NADPH-dependent assimilatory sulfite reductase hemoprotein subunit [Rubinisphaera margarita]MCG6158103.1 NADPH-dependent assimilatory sulfite reductase hemoprotein subunit [Rubinisphaera margarita]